MQVFNSEFLIHDRPEGKNHPYIIITEAGVSYYGDMGLEREFVDLAAESKADVFKAQVFEIDNSIDESKDQDIESILDNIIEDKDIESVSHEQISEHV